MKDKRHIKSFNEATENLNISDVSHSFYGEIKAQSPMCHVFYTLLCAERIIGTKLIIKKWITKQHFTSKDLAKK